MVEFLTLFLGLVRGPQMVELTVVGPVAEVEVRLDGEELATLTAPPWVLEIDLGGELLPHDLAAVARDPSGRVVDRAERWINLSLSRAGARMAFVAGERGDPEAVRLRWESIGQTRLEDVEIELDGRPLPVDDPENVPLPEHRADEFHYLSGSVRFPGAGSHRLETDYGGPRSAEISTELTAVAVSLDPRGGLPPAAGMSTWFVKDGRPLQVHGVEKGDADLIVVLGPGTREALDRLAAAAFSSVVVDPARPRAGWDPARFFGGDPRQLAERVRDLGPALEGLREAAPLDSDLRLRFVSPRPAPLSPRGIEPESFARSREYRSDEGGWLQLVPPERSLRFAPKLAEAVALAGILAHSGNRRRAVLLILGDGAEDQSAYSAAVARDYLSALRVPLAVWALGSGSPGRREDWPGIVDLGDPSRPRKALRNFEAAADELRRSLRRQRVIWLEGRHLPQRVELAPPARGIRLAGS